MPVSKINDIAVASRTASGQPVIYFNAFYANTVSRQMEMFFFAHECAHHALAHAIRNIPFVSEQ
jgi:hypothetical protein